MPSYRYDRLSAQDAAFLSSEGPNTPMHVASVFISDAEPLRTEEGGIDIDRIRRFIASRLHLIPRYRQRIRTTPLSGSPIWVDDPHFSIDFHVRHAALPRPGNVEQLKRLAGRIIAQPLDRERPLWEIWFVEGLERGDRFATISKVHHCMIDGASGAELMTVLMSLSPDEKEPGEAPRYLPRPAPGNLELLRDEIAHYAAGPFDAARRIRHMLGEESPGEELRAALSGVREFLGQGLTMASETPFNQPIGPHRRFDSLAMSLADVKAVKDKLGGTLNDVVLATVAGAVRRYLRRRRVDPSQLDFRVSAPVSMRSEVDTATMGNRVSAWIVPLPIDEPDAATRLEHIRKTTSGLKQSKGALGADLLSAATEWTGTTLLSLGARLQNVALPANMIVTNVPGPQIPLYTLGGRLLEAYPIVPLFAQQGLGVALFSYDGRLFWGLDSDPDLVPDLADFRRDLADAFDELRTDAGLAPVTPAD
jgi:WS/DGAT/MGAT family acyltransferase